MAHVSRKLRPHHDREAGQQAGRQACRVGLEQEAECPYLQPQHEAEAMAKVGAGHNFQSPPSSDVLPPKPTKQHVQLRTECSNPQACGGVSPSNHYSNVDLFLSNIEDSIL